MSVILCIREFLRLDEKTLEADKDFTDALGLYIVAKKDFMVVPCDGCFCYQPLSFPHNTISQVIDNPVHDLHFTTLHLHL